MNRDIELQSASHFPTSNQHSQAPSTASEDLAKSLPDRPVPSLDPQSWSKKKKLYASSVPMMTMFAVNFTAAIYAAAIPAIAADLHVSEELAISGLSFYALGIGLGPLLAAPISELFGRAVIYCYAPIPTLACLAGCCAAKDFGTIAVLRFLTGVCGSPAMAVGGATLADVWNFKTEPLGALMLFLCIDLIFISAELGPVAGGLLVEKHGWRWTFWVPLMLTGAIWLFSIPSPETSYQIIKRRQGSGNSDVKQDASKSFLMVMRITLTRALHMLFTEPVVFITALYMSFTLAVFYLFYIAYPYVLVRAYRFDLRAIGLSYLALMIGGVLAIFVAPVLDKLLYQKALIKAQGRPTPEARMRPAMVPAVLMPISLFWLAWSARPSVHWICPMIGAAIFGLCQVLVFLYYTAYILEVYTDKLGASALAATIFMRYLFSAAFPLFGTYMLDKLTYEWGLSLMGFIALLLLPIPWTNLKWGGQMRAKSVYATHS